MIQAALLAGAILWIASANPPRYLWNYLFAQGFSTLFLYGLLTVVAVNSRSYQIAWILCSEFIQISIIVIALHFSRQDPAERHLVGGCAALGFAAAMGVSLAAGRGLRDFEWIALVSGSIMLACSVSTAICARFQDQRNKSIAQILAPLWFLQALWQFGCVLNPDSPVWELLNFVGPTMLCFAAWAWLGVKLRTMPKK